MDQQQKENMQQEASSPNAATEQVSAPQIKSVGRNIVLPSNALGRIKSDAKEKGKKEAFSELEQQAKEAGFSSVQEMFGTLKGLTAAKAQQAQQKPQRHEQTATPKKEVERSAAHDRNAPKWDRERERYNRMLDAEKRARQEESRKRRELQRALDAAQARADLEKSAIQYGVKDVDYAVNLLLRQLEGREEKDLQGFDEQKFFENLRESRPYLFGEITKPATTGTAGGIIPSSPKPGQISQAVAAGGQLTAMQKNEKGELVMSDVQFKELLRKRGINLGPSPA